MKLKFDISPARKMLITMNTSSNSPALVHKDATPRASPPADNVPRARLNPLLSVEPAKRRYVNFKFNNVSSSICIYSGFKKKTSVTDILS